MKLTNLCLICLAATFLLPSMAWTQSGAATQISAVGADPSDMFLHAWNSLSSAEKAAKQRNYMEAVRQMRECDRILAAIAKDRPDWKTNMVSFRRQKNRELQEKWIELAKDQASNTPIAPPTVEKKPSTPPRPTTRPKATPISTPSLPSAPSKPTYESMQAKAGRQASSGGINSSFSPAVLPEQGESSYDRLNRELMKIQMENRALIKALHQTRKELEDALVRKVHAESGEASYKSQLKELRSAFDKERATGNNLLGNLSKKLNETEEKLKTAEQENKKVQSDLAQLQKRLQETETQLTEVSQERNSLQKERDSLKKDRDHLAAILELNSPEKTKNLLDRNLTLIAQLKESQNKIQQLESEKFNSEEQKAVNLQELERTREESAKIKLTLSSLMDENVGYRRRIAELNTQLTNSEAELSKIAKLPKADPIAIEENRLLRSTVSKQLRLLSSQIKSRDLMMAAYKRLKLQDPDMVESIKMIGDSSLYELTSEEKQLAKSINAKDVASQERNQSIQTELADAEKSAREEQEKIIRRQLESEALGKAALASFQKGRFAAAEQLYRTLIDDQPDLFPARVNIATILLKRNLVEEATAHLAKAIQIDPDSAPANFLMGVACCRAGKDRQAMASFHETVRIQPDNIQAYVYMGNIESSAKNTDKAVEYYNKALALKPALPDVLYNKALTLQEAGKINEARKAYDLAIRSGSLPDPDLERILTPSSEATPQAKEKKQEPPAPAPAPAPAKPTPQPEPKAKAEPAKENPQPSKTPDQTPETKPAKKKDNGEAKAPVSKKAENLPTPKTAKPVPSTPKPEEKEKTPRNRRFRIG